MRVILLLAIFAAVAFAESPRYIRMGGSNDTTCNEGYELVDLRSHYTSNSTVPKKVCVNKDFEEECATPRGAVACANIDAKCVKSDRSRDVRLNPEMVNVESNQEISECVSAGAKVTPDTWVLLPVQATVSFVVIVVVSIIAFLRVLRAVDPWISTTYWLVVAVCIILLPTYYYLNALVAFFATIAATGLFATKDPSANAVGLTILVFAIIWMTFNSGLGYLNHEARLMSGANEDPKTPVYETLCNEYYRYSFRQAWETNKEDNNPDVFGTDVCLREWLAAAYFFAIFLKLLLSMLIAAGGRHLLQSNADHEATA